MLCAGGVGREKVVERGEDAMCESGFGEMRVTACNEVQPRRRGWREVQMAAGAFSICEPRSDRLGLVGEEVVEQDMNLEVPWHVEADQLEEGVYVGGLVRAPRAVEDFAGGDVSRRGQVSGAVPLVVAGRGSCSTRLQAKGRLCTIEVWTLVFSSKLKTITGSSGWR